jgi:2,4-dienoyl-CoA reductase-like NADH-dependent reductase (Old Yellow Enzyme family)
MRQRSHGFHVFFIAYLTMPTPQPTLFDSVGAGDLQPANRIVMAPLTRNCAPNAAPTPLMAQYSAQRASAGLLISEATAISQQGHGYFDVPGQCATDQLGGRTRVTQAVHAEHGTVLPGCQGAWMVNNGLDKALADQAIANPDLIARFRLGQRLNEGDRSSYYGGCARGYTDCPAL